jgi:acyl carrier protein
MDLKEKLKILLIENLDLAEVSPVDIKNHEPLFGQEGGLGLDSLDAVEIVVLVQRDFGVEIKDMEEGITAFQSINALASFIEERQN